MKKLVQIIVLTLSLIITLPAHAAPSHRFIFWHPGEAGTTAQAQPLMDLFAAYLAQKIPGTAWEAQYFSSESGGKQFIRSQRVAFGIVSQLMLQRYEETLGMQQMLATRPLPHGRNRERWYLVRGVCDTTPGIIYTTEPFSSFEVQRLFGQPLSDAQTRPTTDLLGALKAIAAGGCDRALLSERVWNTIQRAGPWAKSLTAQLTSDPVLTPSVVQFPGADSSVATRLTTVLRAMSTDPEGRAILTELRLAGF